MGGTVVDLYTGQFIPVLVVSVECLYEILDTVAAQGGVDVPLETAGQLQATCQLDTHAVTVRHVGGYGFTDFIQLACQDKLVLVVHVVEIGAQMQP